MKKKELYLGLIILFVIIAGVMALVELNSAYKLPGRFVFEGDSITDPTILGGNKPGSWPALLANSTGIFSRGEFNNIAISGDSIANILSTNEYENQARSHRPIKEGDVSYYFIFAGTNDFDINGSPTQVANTYYYAKQLWAKAKADGFKVVVLTMLPSDPLMYSAREEARPLYNAYLASNAPLYDYLVRTDLLFLNPDGTYKGQYLYSADHLHPNDAGNQLIANAVKNVLNKK